MPNVIVDGSKRSKKVNFRQRALRKKQLRKFKFQVLDSLENSSDSSSINRPKKKPVIVIIYER